MHCEELAQILVKEDTSWRASGDDQNTVETASELSQKQEGKISPGSTSTSEYNKSVENPLLLATISNIPEIVKAILDCQPQLLGHTNKKYYEENPLFLATISNIPEIVKAILDRHPQTNKKSHEDLLFLATMSNTPQIVRQILIHHPQAIEHTNKEGMNILHVAILYRHDQIFDMVVEEFEVLSRRLLSATDNEGNSLLHMVGKKKKSQVREKMQNPALQLRTEFVLFKKVKKACQVHVAKPLNKENKTAEELFATRNEQLHKEAKEWLMRTTENCTLLSVFIATVAFAAAYTVPGGPDQNTGIPILNCKPFFVVFILADLISLTWALRSVGIFLSILQSSFLLEDFEKHLFKKLIHGIICLTLSVLMMAVAFGATIILIMEHNWKKAVWHVVAFLPVPIFFLSYSPLLSAVLHTDTGKLFTKVLKSIRVVALVGLIILLGVIIHICRACMGLFKTVAKACELIICKPVRWICYQQTAAPGAEV
ncbi:hypothetical protein AAG906_009949 [Vitis piasezkii]